MIHCTRDWEPSDISTMDYADGFLPVRVDDVRASFNTLVNYWHYSVTFPNRDVGLKLSGNYAVIFFHEGRPDDVVAVATFSVDERLAFVDGTVSANTDIDYMARHQQLTLGVGFSPKQLPGVDVASEVSLVVEQNRRASTRRVINAPSRIGAGRADYEHCRDLIFDAGNNFRRFEFVDEHYTTIGVDKVRFQSPYFYVMLTEDKPRRDQPYYYDQTQHGRFLVKARGVRDSDIEADYFYAFFRLKSAPLPDEVCIDGDFAAAGSSPLVMHYDSELGEYLAKVLLKQGAYNYTYGNAIEGNHYETPNRYDIRVYYRPFGSRYDRLIGVAELDTK